MRGVVILGTIVALALTVGAEAPDRPWVRRGQVVEARQAAYRECLGRAALTTRSSPDASAAHRQQCDVPRLAPTVSASGHYCELCRAGRGIPLAPGWTNFPEPLITGVLSWPAPSSEGVGTPHAP